MITKSYSQKSETKNQKTIVVLYFDSFSTTELCPEVKAFRESVVTDLKQSVVKIYDYYNTGNYLIKLNYARLYSFHIYLLQTNARPNSIFRPEKNLVDFNVL